MTPLRYAALALLVALVLIGVLLITSGGDAPSSRITPLAETSSTAAPRSEATLSRVTRDEDAAPAASSPSVAPPAVGASSSGALRVRALDHEGRPLAHLRFAAYPSATWREKQQLDRMLWDSATDDEGRASWPEAGKLLSTDDLRGGFAVRLESMLPFGELRFIESARDLDVEHEFRAPGFGSVVVRVLDALERPASQGSVALIAWTGRGLAFGPPAQQDDHLHAPIQGGVARFDHVALDVPLRVNASVFAGPSISAEVPPLRIAGEERVVVLRFGSDRAILRLRVCDEAGRPIAGESRVDAHLNAGGRSVMTGLAFTDAASVLWLEIPADVILPTEVELLLSSSGDQPAGSAVVRAEVAQSRGLIDLGDVLLRRGPLAVEGRVLRPDGTPASGAVVEASWTHARQTGNAAQLPSASLPVEDAEGRFAWHETRDRAIAETEVVLEAALVEINAPVLRSRRVRVALGTQDVELRLEEPSSILATWRKGTRWVHDDFEAHLHPEDPADSTKGRIRGSVSPNGIVFPPQLAGRYTMRLRAQGELVLEIKDIVVRGGASCDDPRLRDIDLGERVTLLAYELEPLPGRTDPPAGTLYARPSGVAHAKCAQRDFFGPEARIVLPKGRYDVALRAAGARLVRFSEVVRGQRVELEAGLAVSLALEGQPKGLAEGELLSARLELALDGILLPIDSERFDAGGTARVALPTPGRYRVTFRREVLDGTQFRSIDWTAPASSIEIAEGPHEQRVIIPAPRTR